MNSKRNVQQRSLTSFFQPPTKKQATIEPCFTGLPNAEQPNEKDREEMLTTETTLSLTSGNVRNICDKENQPSNPSFMTSINQNLPSNKIRVREFDRINYRQSTNLIHQIYQQSTYGTRITHYPRVRWSAPSWLPMRPARATSMSFDATGVLLAVAVTQPHSGIRVYDWDMLQATDLHCRRRLTSSLLEMEPIIDMSLSRTVSFVQWNPFQQDILAVGIRDTGTVLLYDMGLVVGWDHRRGTIPVVELKTGIPAPAESLVIFIEKGKHVLVSANQYLSCWDLDPNDSLAPARRRWTLDLRRRITSLLALNTHLLAIGYVNGIIAIMDLHRLTKQPFSSALAPTIVKEFNTLRQLQSPVAQHMGIRGLVADPAGPPGWIRLKWVTSCGWYLSSLLDWKTFKMEQVHVDHAMSRMQCRKAGGERLPDSPNSWSLPVHHKVLVAQSKTMLFWENVPTVTQILPGHNSRAEGDDVCRYVRIDNNPSLLWMENEDYKVKRIPLSKSKGNPTCFAVHPQLEWIVVGTEENHLYLINSRAKITV